MNRQKANSSPDILQKGLTTVVKGYRLFLSPWLGSSCRFEPTCSKYALQALEKHGGAKGAYLAAKRIMRCGPWCEGGIDNVPENVNFAKNTKDKPIFTHLQSKSQAIADAKAKQP